MPTGIPSRTGLGLDVNFIFCLDRLWPVVVSSPPFKLISQEDMPKPDIDLTEPEPTWRKAIDIPVDSQRLLPDPTIFLSSKIFPVNRPRCCGLINPVRLNGTRINLMD